jgi:hypothetical protein
MMPKFSLFSDKMNSTRLPPLALADGYMGLIQDI